MNEPPADVDLADLLRVVRQAWDPAVDSLTHLAVGFGAHHWQAATAGEASYFVTLDRLGPRHTFETLRAAYAGAAALARAGLDFVIAPMEPVAVRCAGGAVSVTPWFCATTITTIDTVTTAAMLTRLHAVEPGTLGVQPPLWRPVVGSDLVERIAALTRRPWNHGPHGERSRAAISTALTSIERWTQRYLELAVIARSHRWVPTHGEPGHHNQLLTTTGTVLVDWESLKLAPVERDLRTLDQGDRQMLDLFDLEWRLSEISQYTSWFAGPHGDTADDRAAFDDLQHELIR